MDAENTKDITNKMMFLAKEVQRMGGHIFIKETGENSHCMTFDVKIELWKKDDEKKGDKK